MPRGTSASHHFSVFPGELKNRVYEIVLGGKLWDIKSLSVRGTFKPAILNSDRSALSLLRVCRQVHAETALLLFRMSTFAVELRYGDDLSSWLFRACLGHATGAITSIRLAFHTFRTFKLFCLATRFQGGFLPFQILPALQRLHVCVKHHGRAWSL